MKLKINPDPQFTTEVGISVPGVKEPVMVKITYKYKDRDEYLAYMEERKEMPIVEMLPDLITDWEGFDEKFSAEALTCVLKKYPATSQDMFNVYTKELFASKVKN